MQSDTVMVISKEDLKRTILEQPPNNAIVKMEDTKLETTLLKVIVHCVY